MYKKEIEYVDFNGTARKDTYYFNLTQAEIAEFENSKLGGLTNFVERIINADDNVQLMKLFKELIMISYGEKSQDGRRFVKSEEASIAFTQTQAYSELFVELCTDSKFAAEFVNGVIAKVEKDPNQQSFASAFSAVK